MIKRRKKGEETRARKCVYSFKEILFIILINEMETFSVISSDEDLCIKPHWLA